MIDSYIGQIMLFGFDFEPKNWAFCNGQLMSIAQNSALFSLLGITYGGDGETTFALPNLQGRVPIHQGHGAGLNPYTMGQAAGTEEVTLMPSQMPMHSHDVTLRVSEEPANSEFGNGNVFGSALNFVVPPATEPLSGQGMIVGSAGASQAHPNMQPYLTVNYCICLYGIYPARN
jgi:microcystin-dependent protein